MTIQIYIQCSLTSRPHP